MASLTIVKKAALLVILILLLAAGYWLFTNRYMFISPGEVKVTLLQQGDSEVGGEAKLTDSEGGLVVELDLPGGVVGQAIIQKGSCAEPGETLFVVDGAVPDTSLSSLARQKPVNLSVRKSEFEPLDKVACGDIPL